MAGDAGYRVSSRQLAVPSLTANDVIVVQAAIGPGGIEARRGGLGLADGGIMRFG